KRPDWRPPVGEGTHLGRAVVPILLVSTLLGRVRCGVWRLRGPQSASAHVSGLSALFGRRGVWRYGDRDQLPYRDGIPLREATIDCSSHGCVRSRAEQTKCPLRGRRFLISYL